MIYFIVYLFLEVLLSVNISSYIGGLNTFFEIILTAFIGISILVNFRKTLVENLTCKDGADMLLGQGILANELFTNNELGTNDIKFYMQKSFEL